MERARSSCSVDSYGNSSSVAVSTIWFMTATTKWRNVVTTRLTRSREKYVRRHAQRYVEQFRWYDSRVTYLAASCLSLNDDSVCSRSARRPQNSSMEERSSSVERKQDWAIAAWSLVWNSTVSTLVGCGWEVLLGALNT